MIASPTLTTKRLTLRQPVPSDLPAYTDYCASKRSHFVRGPFTAPQAFEKFSSMIGHWAIRGFGRYVITRDCEPIGHAGPLAIDHSDPPELTWTLWDGAAEGHGYATEAALAVKHHLLSELGWPELIIRIMPDNHGACRIAERIGAELTSDEPPEWYAGSITYRLRAGVTA
ncbi:MAG: GNAT family N-acetyltransferase [Pseudomonadota bacterium]